MWITIDNKTYNSDTVKFFFKNITSSTECEKYGICAEFTDGHVKLLITFSKKETRDNYYDKILKLLSDVKL